MAEVAWLVVFLVFENFIQHLNQRQVGPPLVFGLDRLPMPLLYLLYPLGAGKLFERFPLVPGVAFPCLRIEFL